MSNSNINTIIDNIESVVIDIAERQNKLTLKIKELRAIAGVQESGIDSTPLVKFDKEAFIKSFRIKQRSIAEKKQKQYSETLKKLKTT